VVAAPADKVEDSVVAKLLDQMRVTLARLRQAGMPPDELLLMMRREVRNMGARRKGEGETTMTEGRARRTRPYAAR
jgi:hypothetical protein